MSVDEVLASSLWLWPDPLLKRDRAGQVLFINAAFLQLYGGQAQDWHGKPLTGWPAPVSSGAQRFETRVGEGAHENVYDWVESAMADGNALSIARNVTVFMTPPQQQQPPQTPAPAAQQAQQPAPPAQNTANVVAAQQTTQPPTQPPAPSLEVEIEQTRSVRADEFALEDNQAEQYEPAGQALGQALEQTVPQDLAAASAIQPEPAQPEEPEERRMIERRALPIKDSTVVLGSNWRDEVIAKAVGATSPEDEEGLINIETSEGTLQTDEASDNLPGKSAQGLRILLAEDNAINALLTRTLLEAEGAEVDTVEDGALALTAVGQKTYDLIFMDMRMPNMDGLESTRKIRAFGAKMPIIALTANAFDDDRNACFDSGMNDFMTKPVSAEELSEMVENWTKTDEGDKRLAS